MDLLIHPHKLNGSLQVIPSKSQAHRYLICAAFADGPTIIKCSATNRDMDATMDCLNALGAEITKDPEGYLVKPIGAVPQKAELPCRDSGSTLRFLLPVAGALGVDATFCMEGRLPSRPLSPLWEEMERMGCTLTRPTETTLRCQGKLKPGTYRIDGGVSSQFITGLLFALSCVPGRSDIQILGNLESRPYIDMTRNAMEVFGLPIEDFHLPDKKVFHSPGMLTVEGDWSNAAFFLAADFLGSQVEIPNLNMDSHQGDRAIANLLIQFADCPTISVADIPDLTPILAVTAACRNGAVFKDIRRLRLKESDRVETIIRMITALGGKAQANKESLKVYGTGLSGGTVDACNDHRIAMAAAIAATAAKHDVTILGADCVSKSYPEFFQEYRTLGGNYEQYIR